MLVSMVVMSVPIRSMISDAGSAHVRNRAGLRGTSVLYFGLGPGATVVGASVVLTVVFPTVVGVFVVSPTAWCM